MLNNLSDKLVMFSLQSLTVIRLVKNGGYLSQQKRKQTKREWKYLLASSKKKDTSLWETITKLIYLKNEYHAFKSKEEWKSDIRFNNENRFYMRFETPTPFLWVFSPRHGISSSKILQIYHGIHALLYLHFLGHYCKCSNLDKSIAKFSVMCLWQFQVVNCCSLHTWRLHLHIYGAWGVTPPANKSPNG